jgi:protein TonB
MATTINAFPPVHAFNSSRSWVLAIIVLIHLGFFWALTSGLARSVIQDLPLVSKAFVIEAPPEIVDPPAEPPAEPIVQSVYVPDVPVPSTVADQPDTAPRIVTTVPREQPPIGMPSEPARPSPVEVGPQIDPRRGLSEPLYPASAIRGGDEGTVILLVQVLENGRVGEVRLERSSGHVKLDESAMREAKRWKLIPGTRDGVPVVLWKQIPITFRLQDAR